MRLGECGEAGALVENTPLQCKKRRWFFSEAIIFQNQKKQDKDLKSVFSSSSSSVRFFFFFLRETELQRGEREKGAMCFWLLSLASLEPGWAWASKCQSDKDQAWQTDTGVLSFCVSSLLLASPIFASLQIPKMMVGVQVGVREGLSGRTSCCVTPPSATIAPNVGDVSVPFGWPLRASIIVLCAAQQVHHGNTKRISCLPTKGHQVTQQEDVPVSQRLGSEAPWWEVAFTNKIYYSAIHLRATEFISRVLGSEQSYCRRLQRDINRASVMINWMENLNGKHVYE